MVGNCCAYMVFSWWFGYFLIWSCLLINSSILGIDTGCVDDWAGISEMCGLHFVAQGNVSDGVWVYWELSKQMLKCVSHLAICVCSRMHMIWRSHCIGTITWCISVRMLWTMRGNASLRLGYWKDKKSGVLKGSRGADWKLFAMPNWRCGCKESQESWCSSSETTSWYLRGFLKWSSKGCLSEV